MEAFFTRQTPKARWLIRALGALLGVFVLVAMVLMVTLSVYQTANVPTGLILAENGPAEYIAPFDAEVRFVHVGIGDSVATGDTLLELYSAPVAQRYAQLQNERRAAGEQVALYERLIENARSRLEAQNGRETNIEKTLRNDRAANAAQVETLKRQLYTLRRRLDISERRLEKDRALYREGLISELELQQKQKDVLAEGNAYQTLYRQYQTQKDRSATLRTERRRRENDQALTVLGAENELLNTQKLLQTERDRILQLDQQLSTEELQFAKQYLIAAFDGQISQVFNLGKQQSNIYRGQLLLTLTPSSETTYFARLVLPQANIKSVRPGQTANIKLDAYNYYQYGVLKGKILHVDRDTSEQFYALASLPRVPEDVRLRSGYKLKADIITDKVKLWRFIGDTMFEK